MKQASDLQCNMMKGVTSEDNLLGYCRTSNHCIDPVKINSKIKSLKVALKKSELHNEELHLKINTLQESHRIQVMHLDHQLRKMKERYDSLSENYEIKSLEAREYKKRLKRAQANNIYTAGTQLSLEEAQETGRQYRQTIIKQEKQMGRLREEAKLLYQQLYEKAGRVKELEQILLKGFGKSQQKDKMFLANLRNALESKNEEFQKIIQEKALLSTTKASLEKDHSELSLKLARAAAELDFERKAQVETKLRAQKQEKQVGRLREELRGINDKYSQLLTFSYELQKDFERDIAGISRELSRRDPAR